MEASKNPDKAKQLNNISLDVLNPSSLSDTPFFNKQIKKTFDF